MSHWSAGLLGANFRLVETPDGGKQTRHFPVRVSFCYGKFMFAAVSLFLLTREDYNKFWTYFLRARVSTTEFHLMFLLEKMLCSYYNWVGT